MPIALAAIAFFVSFVFVGEGTRRKEKIEELRQEIKQVRSDLRACSELK